MKLSNYRHGYDERSEFLSLLRYEWDKHPNLSFADLMSKLCRASGVRDMWDADDHKMLKALRRSEVK